MGWFRTLQHLDSVAEPERSAPLRLVILARLLPARNNVTGHISQVRNYAKLGGEDEGHTARLEKGL